MMSDHILKAFEAAFGVWTTTGYFKHKPTQHQLDGFRKGYAIAEQASADRIAKLEQQSVDNLLLREGGYPHLPESNQLSSNPLQLQSQAQQTESQDAKRLDFVLSKMAFVEVVRFDDTFNRYKLMSQNEDEEFFYLHDENKSFATEREAIDAAMSFIPPAPEGGRDAN